MTTTKTKISILRILLLLTVSLVLSIGGFEVWDSDYCYSYRQYFFNSTDKIDFDFRELTPITEAETKKKYPIDWFCRANENQFGDRFCADTIVMWNGIPAMNVVFWYRNGKLTNAKVDVPPWHHEKLANYLNHTYGHPKKTDSQINIQKVASTIFDLVNRNLPSDLDVETDRAGLWELGNGSWVMANIQRDQNPIQWDTIMWFGSETAKNMQIEIEKEVVQHE